MHKLSDIVREDWVGRQVEIVDARNEKYLGIIGKVIDETKHFLVIKTLKKAVRVFKRGCVFQVSWNSGKFRVRGDAIEVSPEERLKLKV